MNHYDAIIIGAGAAGLMCAITAANRGRRVLLLEHNESVGKKIRISGGGRCNFTNVNAEPSRYVSTNPRFCYSALSRYTPADFVHWIERHGIAYHEKKLGQLFCDGSAQQVIDGLLDDCAQAGVDLRVGCRVESLQRGDQFNINTSLGEFEAPALVVACGGLSIPKLGATDLGYRIARQFEIPIIAPLPGLVPLTLPPEVLQDLADLSGISFDAEASVDRTTFRENVLITHRGLSGPAILQVSSFWKEGLPVNLNLFPEHRLEDELLRTKRNNPKGLPRTILSSQLSSRLAQRLCERNGWERPLVEMADSELRGVAQALQRWSIPIAATEGYLKAEVTRGGVDTRALSPKTMESREVPGLFFIGEVMDVTGWLGGYNFQWAWASAVAAGGVL